MGEQVKKAGRYPAIDGLRAFSAVGIVLMHVLANGSYSLSGFLFDSVIASLGDLVFLFMIISGFAMCCGYHEKIISNRISVSDFYSKRYAKIWPFFAVMCLLELIVSPSLEALYDTFANLTMCFGFLDADISVIGVGWFLGVVFLFYLIFPFFCYLLADRKRAWFAFGVALLLNLICHYHFGLTRSNFAFCAVYFMAGGLIYLYRERLEVIADKYRWLLLGACAAATAGYFLLGAHMPIMLVTFSLYTVYAMGSSRRLLYNPVTRFLSSISLEIYLCHMILFRVLEKLKLTTLLGNGVLSYVLTAAVTLIGAIVFSYLLQKALSFAGGKLRRS